MAVRKITKFKSKNLLGETRKEEVRRISQEMSKRIVRGATISQIRRLPSTVGASKSALARRRVKIKDIKDFKPLTAKERLSMIS